MASDRIWLNCRLLPNSGECAADGSEKRFRRCLGKQKPRSAVFDRVGKPPGSVPDRQRTETLRIHLAQTAGLEAGRHHGEIAARENAPGCRIIEPDRDAYRTAVRLAGLDKRRFELGLPRPITTIWPPAATMDSAVDSTKSTPF